MTNKYMTFDESGHIKDRLIRGVCDIPEGAVRISEELWLQSAIDMTGQWCLVDGALTKIPFEDTVDFAKLIAVERFHRETSGVEFQGSTADTTRDGQALVASAAVAAILDPSYKCAWKFSEGFAELEAAQIIAMATLIRTHVQDCFDRERVLLAAVESGECTEEMIHQGWPNSARLNNLPEL
ncbi:DUF4376 domain-containing protein [Pseudomonas siliginis]|uniref:DUF4376 domain-containing protein n=1 Tax=Pseudomonas siliginis TaxID=2842346 RepID=UPI0020923A8A|nr:DUF4376 domain-containing protein [Pseudomonas siliginis]UST96561.1 DUF4376 domain-containing protein [Pseudomonas siliginis]